MPNHYHQQALDLLEVTSSTDPLNVHLLHKCEHAYGFQFPASLKEWYAYREAIDILEQYSNDDQPLDLTDIFAASYHRRTYHFWTFPTPDFIPIMLENQGGELWCVALDGTDDPPVGYWDYFHEWIPCAPTFSEFICQQIWQWIGIKHSGGYTTSLDRQEFPLPAIRSLLRTYDWVYTAAYPSGIAHFKTQDTCVLFRERERFIDLLIYTRNRIDQRSVFAYLERLLPIDRPVWLRQRGVV